MTDADRAADIIAEMSLEDKVALACGDFAAVVHLGLPALSFTDGGNGVRVAGDATAFPVCLSLAASFDERLAGRFGSAVGREARSAGHNVLPGPALDIARTPLAGQLPEAFGEDPYLTGVLGAAYVRGVQENVVAMVKHFVVNNFETGRTGAGWPPPDRGPAVDVHVSRRALEEIYFAVRDPLAAARGGLDLPGLDDAEGRRPEDFTSGRVSRERLDDVVRRMVGTMVTHSSQGTARSRYFRSVMGCRLLVSRMRTCGSRMRTCGSAGRETGRSG